VGFSGTEERSKLVAAAPDTMLAVARLLTGLLMLAASVAAWAGLAWLILNVPPSRAFAPQAAYVFAFAALTSTAALLAWLVLRPRSPATSVAHAMVLAVIVTFGLWLQSLRVLTPTVALLLVGLYAFLELAILFGTRGSVELSPNPSPRR
jgi:hypothetical protein